MMKYIATLFLALLLTPTFAQEIIEPCKFGQDLLDALKDSYTPNNPLGYGEARDILYSEIDNNGLELSGIYTGFTVTLEAGADPSVSAFQGGAGINAEHVYPQSLGASEEPAKSDLHNIFPSKVNVNAARGNCSFNEIEDNDTDQWFYLNTQSNSIPSSDIDKYSEKDEEDCAFEPRENVKGDIARAMFYFYAIYQVTADAINAGYLENQKAVLYQWHIADPVDVTERTRDSLIMLQQGNHNPFIRDSSLIQRAYFMADASFPDGDANCYNATTSANELLPQIKVQIASNLVTDVLSITMETQNALATLYNLQGQEIHNQALQTSTDISVNHIPSGLYILYVRTAQGAKAFRFFKQ